MNLDGLENYGISFAHLKNFLTDYPSQDIANIGGYGDENKIESDVYDLMTNNFDICKQPLPKMYETIICLNTFEHLRDPIRSAENMVKSLKTNGHLFATMPFVYHKHDYDNVPDYYRYTTTGTEYLFRELRTIKLDCVPVSELRGSEEYLIIYIGQKK